MNVAAMEAEKELINIMTTEIDRPVLAEDVFNWHKKWTSSAGHKRLGRIMNQYAKK